MKKELKLSSMHIKEEKQITKLFHINFQVKKTKVNALFDSSSKSNLVIDDLVSTLVSEFHDHPHPYPLGWIKKGTKLMITRQ
jgi:hypothetical protein